MRFLSIFLILVASLSSCSLPGTTAETPSAAGLTPVSKWTISINLPTNWIETKASDLPTPKTGQVALAYTAPESTKGFFNNLVIMEDDLTGLITSKKYSEVNQLQTSRNYLEYTKLQDEALLFADDDESRVYVFEAKYNQTTPRMKFVETAKVCGKKVYLLHFSITLDKSPDAYKELLKSFACK